MARRAHAVYRQPVVTKGADQQIPEQRENVREKIAKRLADATDGVDSAIRQDYSNGEFISRSLIVSRTFTGVASRALDLDTAGYTAHFDPVLNVWWREGGAFD